MASVLPREHKKLRLNSSLLHVYFFFILLWPHIYVLGNAVTWLTQINVPIKYYIVRFVRPMIYNTWFKLDWAHPTMISIRKCGRGGDTERVVNNTCGCWFQPTGPWLGLLLSNTHAQLIWLWKKKSAPTSSAHSCSSFLNVPAQSSRSCVTSCYSLYPSHSLCEHTSRNKWVGL